MSRYKKSPDYKKHCAKSISPGKRKPRAKNKSPSKSKFLKKKTFKKLYSSQCKLFR